jgi:K+-transporting ATPase KdpF subunit
MSAWSAVALVLALLVVVYLVYALLNAEDF